MPQTPTASTTDKKSSPPAGSKEYRYMGNHAMEMQVGDNLPWLEPGEFVTLTDEEAGSEKTQYLIDSGTLVDISTIGAESAPATEAQGTEATTEEKGGK